MKTKKRLNYPILAYTGILAFFIVLGVNICFPSSSQAKVSLGYEERKFIQNINDYREKKGRDPLKISVKLSKSALAMAQDMADNPDTINHEHKDSQGRLPAERASIYGYTDGVGENLAAGYETADKIFKAWKGSVEHNQNMVDKDYEVMGIALVSTDNNYKWYWVNMFGEKEHNSDLMDENDYNPMIKMRVVVTNSSGSPLKKAKITILDKNKHKIVGSKANNKGKKSFWVSPRNEFYVRASIAGYKFYVKKVEPGDKEDITVKLWLDKD